MTMAGWPAVFGPAPAAAFHDLECAPGRTVVDGETGQRRCVTVLPLARQQFSRARTLQQEQERRGRALQLQQTRGEPVQEQDRLSRDLLQQQTQRELRQEAITRAELTRQQRFQRARTEQALQPAFDNAQAAAEQEILLRASADEARRQAEARAGDLALRQNLLQQQQALPTTGLQDEQRNFSHPFLNKER
jgi:hypothetical protein